MLGATLVLMGLLGQVEGGRPDATVLVAQLGSGRYAEREAASAALERLGRSALPALLDARDDRDLEVRTRAFALIQKIEGTLLTQPTRVRLDFENTPLTEVTKSLTQQTGFKVTLYPENLPKWKYQRVTIRESEPVDFWKAIDLLCDAGMLQYNPGMNGYVGHREPICALTDGISRTITPISDHGPFRVSLLSLHYQRDLNYAPGGIGMGFRPIPGAPIAPARRPIINPNPNLNPGAQPGRPAPVTSVQFNAQLMVAAEPRLSLSQNGPLQMQEAVDNRGNSLIVPGNGGAAIFSRTAGYFGMIGGSVIQLQAQLHPPATTGDSIKKLRGVIPVTVSSRRPDPLVVPLAQAAGKTFENPDVRLTIHDVRTIANNHQTTIEISVKANDQNKPAERDEPERFSDVLHRPDTQHLQIEVYDTRGQLIPWFQSGLDSETSHVTLTLTNVPQAASLKELRYYTLTRATVSIPFEFTDIPMP